MGDKAWTSRHGKSSTGQMYGELAQVYRTWEDFEYDTPIKPTVSRDGDTDTMERAMYMERMAEYRKAKATQNSMNIQLYSELYNKLLGGFMRKAPRRPSMGRS